MQSGYAIESLTSSVANVTVYGSQSVVDSLDYVEAVVDVNKLDKEVLEKILNTNPIVKEISDD